nr:unnamed protein product [Callosobruchus analis]
MNDIGYNYNGDKCRCTPQIVNKSQASALPPPLCSGFDRPAIPILRDFWKRCLGLAVARRIEPQVVAAVVEKEVVPSHTGTDSEVVRCWSKELGYLTCKQMKTCK